MNQEQLQQFGARLVQTLLAEKVVPAQVLADLGRLVHEDGTEAVRVFRGLWDKGNQIRTQSGGSQRNLELPLLITGGFDQDTAEEELGRILPEERILINKELFRQKLSAVNFSNLDGRKEQALIDELHRESIGLSRDEAALYFNFIKVNALSGAVRQSAQAKAPPPTADYPKVIYGLAETKLNLNIAVLTKLNAGKPIPRDAILNILDVAIKRNKLNPRIVALLLGQPTDKFLKKIVKFLDLTATQRGDGVEELAWYLGVYLLLGSAEDTLLKDLALSSPLEAFLTGKIGRMREIYYVSLLFSVTFFIVLLSQVTEIATKFQQSPPDQQAKLVKLYQADERRAMLVQNAANLATKRIADFRVESREVLSNLKRFLASNPDLVTADDLFKTQYPL
jgi:hypothetical protein